MISLPKCLSSEENKELFIKMINGDTCVREQIIKGNLRLVYSLARRIYYIDFDDCFQIGVESLIRAVDKFDVSKNIDFASYLCGSFYNAIRSSTSFNTFSMGNEKEIQLWEIRKYMESFFSEKSIYPSYENVSQKFGISKKEVMNLLNTIDPVSFDVLSETKDVCDKKYCLEEQVLNKVYVESILMCLDEIYQRRIKQYYGIGCLPLTLEEIAKKEKVSKQCIQQSLNQAYKQIRYMKKSKF